MLSIVVAHQAHTSIGMAQVSCRHSGNPRCQAMVDHDPLNKSSDEETTIELISVENSCVV